MKSGDMCQCGGVFGVYAVRARGNSHVRFVRCDRCRETDKDVVPAAEVARRKTRPTLKYEQASKLRSKLLLLRKEVLNVS